MPGSTQTPRPTVTGDLERMHEVYLSGGKERGIAPQVVYADQKCPHQGCSLHLQAIDFRLEAHGRNVHDPLVRAWWADVGFAGRCPQCGGWIHVTVRGKRAIDDAEAATLPQLPEDWFAEAVVL